MAWKTVPNFFPDYDELDGDSQYHLCEGYCLGGYDTKPSGRHYKKVRVKDLEDYHRLLSFLGLREWWMKYELKSNWLGMKSWKKRKTEKRA